MGPSTPNDDAPTRVTDPEDVVLPEAEPADDVVPVSRSDAFATWASHLRPAWRGLFAYLIYQALAFAIWAVPILPRFTVQHVGVGLQDSRQFQWWLTWTPWAIAHHLNPLHTSYVFAPSGADLAWFAFIPGPAIVMWPVTALFGPMTSLNTLMVAAPALAAWATYLVCNRITHRFWPSLVGGFLFGFSAYIAGNTIGFVNLSLIFPVPLLVYLVIRRVEGSLGPVSFVAAFSATLIGLFSISTELFGTAAIFLGLAFLIALAFGGPIRRAIFRTGALVLLSGAIAAIVLLPYLIDVLQNAPSTPLYPPELMPAADAWTFIVPAPYTRLFGDNDAVSRFLSTHVANPVLDGVGYVGLGVVALLIGFAITERKRRETWPLLGFVALMAVLTMGPVLRVGGGRHGWLPWHLFTGLPVVESMIPARFAAFSALAVAVIAAIWLARGTGRLAWVRWVFVLAAATLLFPDAPTHTPPNVIPAFFTSGTVQRMIQPGENVYGIGVERGDELVWQESADYWFRLAEGYLGPLPLEMRTGPLSHGVTLRKSGVEPVGPAAFVTWMAQRDVSAILIDDRALDMYRSLLEDSGLQPVYQGEGLSVWRPEGGVWHTSASGAGQG
jgi:hypothetical protein